LRDVLRVAKKLDNRGSVICVVEALDHLRAAHHRGRIGEIGSQRIGCPSDAGIAQGRRVVEPFDAAGGAADHALQMRADAVAGCRDLVASAASLAEETLSLSGIRFLGDRCMRCPGHCDKRRGGEDGIPHPSTPFKSSFESGRLRMRWPVSTEAALTTAGGTPGRPGSPIPPIGAPLSTMRTCTRGMRSGGRIG
jgi:hypothetical protein